MAGKLWRLEKRYVLRVVSVSGCHDITEIVESGG
jgi:hypothetical protein